jgi:uncharacterized protein (DUF983 family)
MNREPSRDVAAEDVSHTYINMTAISLVPCRTRHMFYARHFFFVLCVYNEGLFYDQQLKPSPTCRQHSLHMNRESSRDVAAEDVSHTYINMTAISLVPCRTRHMFYARHFFFVPCVYNEGLFYDQQLKPSSTCRQHSLHMNREPSRDVAAEDVSHTYINMTEGEPVGIITIEDVIEVYFPSGGLPLFLMTSPARSVLCLLAGIIGVRFSCAFFF